MPRSALLRLNHGPTLRVFLPRRPAALAIVEFAPSLEAIRDAAHAGGPSLLRFEAQVRDAQRALDEEEYASGEAIEVSAGPAATATQALRCPSCGRSTTALFAAITERALTAGREAGVCAPCYDAVGTGGGDAAAREG